MAIIGSILWAIIIGGVIGLIARLLIPGRQNIGMGLTIVIGIVAALIGTLVAWLFGVSSTKGIDWIQWALQIGFAIVGVLLVSNRRR
ncbi:GlsB/YeaQ/YmgE family stress response membrane protein [Streptosporangiaceae bacterium NEAU-GS5]|nr:GlsB/YeaQ/YmgE family stress response membrane protein [Streptosporangiaceae bacterium NEAU-GS5]